MEEKNKTLEKIDKYLEVKHWSLYRLAKESGIPYSSLHSMFEKNTQPTIPTLEKLCIGLGISMSEFFSDKIIENATICTEDEQILLTSYRKLNALDKDLLISLSKRFLHK